MKETTGNRVSNQGDYVRAESEFRNWVTANGMPGPSGQGGFKAEPGRYHLYSSYACPWAHRTLIYRRLKGLEKLISLSVVNWYLGEEGWSFEPGEGVIPDHVNGSKFLAELYQGAAPGYSGRVTVPLLWDKKTGTIVSNESAEIIRMFNTAFDGVGALPGDYYPEVLRAEIDMLNARIYETVNNGVYRAGFAKNQEAYQEAVVALFNTLDELEELLSRGRYLTGNRVTEADWRLFTTLIRFDTVYVGHFKCNIKRLVDYPNLWAYTRDLYQHPGISETVHMNHIKNHYYGSHRDINPTGIVPLGPQLELDEPHQRQHIDDCAPIVNF